MLPIHKIIWIENTTKSRTKRKNEPHETMDDLEQVKSYVKAYEWGGPTSALQLYHLRNLSSLIKPGDLVIDLACGPGPLLIELACLFPGAQFIGVDLSPTMLTHLQMEADRLGLKNISTLCEDISLLPSIKNQQINMVITTSALHHLPDENILTLVFQRIASILSVDGGFYMFDFGLLKSNTSRDLFVKEVSKLAPPITARDYELSLQAAYPIDTVFRIAESNLPKPFKASRSAFFDFFYFLHTSPRAIPSNEISTKLKEHWHTLSLNHKFEYLSLRFLAKNKYFLENLS
ncbi:MAG: class I SAM-dependent methyltransferase [Methylomonas sp.]|jgi:ubiquinone/menaquinone biosynthesis C-methylase UbiE|uniref:class I SAM-dependent methyltransferase n=1 Tax=Methylomonas sp. TaxID=418 RepID=UPI0025EDF4F7|nr:class I SAM-dependent methyltransferase [Methylomonas sp.]MCK9606014.1 class I SAM-dependent methyltransferase [Methylomonas sp.]